MRVRFLALAVGLITTLLWPAGAVHAEKSYYISEWNARYEVQPSSDVEVTEEITFDFTGDFRWAERFIPARRVDAIRNIRVTNERGEEPTNLEIDQRGFTTYVRWEHDSRDEERTWTITYTVEGGLTYVGDRDELYWNVTGEEWPVSIRDVTATVALPDSSELSSSDLLHRVRYNDGYVTHPRSEVVDERTIVFTADRLTAENGLTLVANWPKGITERPAREHVVVFWGSVIGTALMVLLGTAIVWLLWRRYGKEHRELRAIVAQYEAPEHIPVDVVHELLGSKSRKNASVPALLIALANKGYLQIEAAPEPDSGVMKVLKKMSQSARYILHRTQPATKSDGSGMPVDASPLTSIQQSFLEALFAEGNPVHLPVTTPRKTLASFLQSYSVTSSQWLKEHGYTEKRSERLRGGLMVGGILLILAGAAIAAFLSIWIHSAFLVGGLGLTILGSVMCVFGVVMRRFSEEGLQAKEYVLGLKDYLQTAERFRMEDVEPEQFTHLLPWAVALGVQKQWAQRFADIRVPEPVWYRGSAFHGSGLAAASAAGSFSSFASDVGTFVSSAGSFSSGLSGGAGVGGGSGGGGGGGGGGAG